MTIISGLSDIAKDVSRAISRAETHILAQDAHIAELKAENQIQFGRLCDLHNASVAEQEVNTKLREARIAELEAALPDPLTLRLIAGLTGGHETAGLMLHDWADAIEAVRDTALDKT